MNWKRILCIIIAVILICMLTACGRSEDHSADNEANQGIGNNNNAPDNSSSGNNGSNNSENQLSPGGDNQDGAAEGSPEAGENNGSTSPNGNAGGDNGGDGALSTASADLLQKIIDYIESADVWIPMSMPPMAAPIEIRHNAIGLSDADYAQYVIQDAQSLAGLATQAHQIIIYQCMDVNAASRVKSLVSGQGGYDPQKWICVFPEMAAVIEAGSYVLLVASSREVVNAAAEAFDVEIGSSGDLVIFYESAE